MYVYIDDVIVFSNSLQEHVQHLNAVLERMNRFGLVTQEKKCSFFVSKIHYLGLEFDEHGYRPLPKLIPKITDYPKPKDRRGVQKFLGLINYYRTHVPKLAEIAHPLYDLLKKGIKFNWTNQHQEAFDTLLKILSHRLTLVPLQPNGKLVLQTDASNIACGAVLLQDSAPVEFFSRKFNTAEQRYSTFEREATALVSAILHFRPILQGRYFEVQTDHRPLLKWKTRPPSSERQARLLVKIQDLDFDVTYVPGESNNLADLLSRPPGQSMSSFQALHNELNVNAVQLSFLTEELRDEQTEEFLESTGIDPEHIREIEGFHYTDHTGRLRLLVPPKFQNDVIKLVHDTGHFGRKRTIKLVAYNYWWKTLTKDCRNYVKYCMLCQQYKPTPKPPREYISFPETSRFRTVHIDLVGPFKRTARGNTSLLTMMDRCSRWIEAYPMQSTTAFACARKFISEWISRFGVPGRIISDRGPQFESLLFNIVCNQLGIKHNRTTAWHPETNGILERAHSTLKNSLRCLCQQVYDWDDALPMALLAMRTAINDLGVSPSLIIYGEQLALPRGVLEHEFPVYNEDMPHFINRLHQNMQFIKDKILNIPQVQQNEYEDYVFPSNYAMMREPQLKPNLEAKWLGPYPVIDLFYPVIRLNIDGLEKNVNLDMVKPAFVLQDINNEDLVDQSEVTDNENLANVDPDYNFDGISLNPQSQDPHLFQDILTNPVVEVRLDPITDIAHHFTQ